MTSPAVVRRRRINSTTLTVGIYTEIASRRTLYIIYYIILLLNYTFNIVGIVYDSRPSRREHIIYLTRY